MSKKNKPGKNKQILPVKNLNKKSTLQWIIPFILLVTFLAYIPVLKAGFVNWDDGDYVTENLLIRSFANIKLLFATPVQGNYHPLTMISLAFNYAISGSQAYTGAPRMARSIDPVSGMIGKIT